MEDLSGKLLISSAGLHDPNFRHTVVLIGAHSEEGALGVVLNRALDVTIDQAVPELIHLTGPEALLYQGGPVQPSQPVLLAELTDPRFADLEIFGPIGFITGITDDALRETIVRARIFGGYSGWGAGQLEDEMDADAWIVEKPQVDDVFTDEPETLWRRVLERKGPEYRLVSRMPYDVRVN